MFYLDNLTMIFYNMQRKKESEAKPNAFIGKTNGLTPDSLTSESLTPDFLTSEFLIKKLYFNSVIKKLATCRNRWLRVLPP